MILDNTIPDNWLLLSAGGLVSGILAGFLGIGGGTLLVPLQVALGYAPVEAVATSSLAILMTALSGSWQNWRMGYLNLRNVLLLGLPALVTAQLGAEVADRLPARWLLVAFGLLLWVNIYLVGLRKRLANREEEHPSKWFNPIVTRLVTGSAAGMLAGLFGVGGGVIMVPLQILLLGVAIKAAIQTSLGAIVITAAAAATGHALKGNVLVVEGVLLGIGGLLGSQLSTRFLPKLRDRTLHIAFRTLLLLLSGYVFWQAWQM